MKYQFYGRKTNYTGKTFWEIVANLKNFGIGRLIKTPLSDYFSEPCFLKIVKIQAFPPSKQPFEGRIVKVWAEEIYRGVNTGVKVIPKTTLSKFKLIPKIEEEKYYKAFEEMNKECSKKHISKYCSWPPLYKIIWEKSVKKESSMEGKAIPMLNTVFSNYPGYEIIKEDKTYIQSTCSLYKSELSVEEMYKEIVKLKKAIKANS